MLFGFGQIARTRQKVRRIAPILKVLIRHGFGHYIHRMRMWHLLPARLRIRLGRGEETEGKSRAISPERRLVLALQELGPTFTKLGQMLATRPDILPESYVAELRSLTEHVPPFDTAVARTIVERELGRQIGDVFADFGPEPIAAGSIGQVYNATLKDGSGVVVKVKRPDIDKTIMADLDLLEFAAPYVTRIEELKPLRPMMLVDEFRRSLKRELDFVSEAAFTSKIGEDLKGNAYVRVPRVYWNLTTADVLVLERLDGVSLNRRDALAAMAPDRTQLANRLAEVFMHMFFKTGLFHADPHPGNILVMPDGRVGLLDFGMTGRLEPDLRRSLATSFIAMARRDIEVIVEVYLEIGVVADGTDMERLRSDLLEVLDKYYGIPIQCLDLRRCFSDVMRVARTHEVVLPRDFVLLGKSFVTMVMMARELDPAFDLSSVAQPYAMSLIAEKLSPGRLVHDAAVEAWNLSNLLGRIPKDLRSMVRKLLAGKLSFGLEIRDIEGFAHELDRATNRMAFSVITGAVVIGSSVLLHARVPPLMENILPGAFGRFFASNMPGISALGLAGYLFAGVLGLLLTWGIWRSGKL